VSAGAPAEHADLAEVEEDAVVQPSLVHVGPDLLLAARQIDLPRALGVEDEPVRDQVGGREVRLQARSAQLGDEPVGGEPEDFSQQVLEHRLGQRLLVVLCQVREREIGAHVVCSPAAQQVVHAPSPVEERDQTVDELVLSVIRHAVVARSSRSPAPARPALTVRCAPCPIMLSTI